MNLEQGGWQVLLAIVLPFVLQWLKRQRWFPFLNSWSTQTWKILVSAFVALCSALGLAYNFDPVVGRLIIDGLTWTNVGHSLLSFVLSFVTQHTAYTLPKIGVQALMPSEK